MEDRRRAVAVGSPLVGCGGLLVALVWVLLGGDPQDAAHIVDASQQIAAPAGAGATAPEDDALADFVAVVLGSTEDVWAAVFEAGGERYRPPTLVLFSGRVDSACGRASAAIGPFYCPADQKAYIDLSFYRELRRTYGAPGDFAQAYVVAHEVGHHVQNLMGISAKVDRLSRGRPEAEANALSVRQELQADCFAGIWAHHADRKQHLLEEGDVEEALRAAEAIGDDTLQHAARGEVAPESFTHGSAEMRRTWLRRGMRSGRLEDCDTFAAPPSAVGLAGGR